MLALAGSDYCFRIFVFKSNNKEYLQSLHGRRERVRRRRRERVRRRIRRRGQARGIIRRGKGIRRQRRRRRERGR